MTPDNVTFEQAASVLVAAFTTLWGLRDKGQIQPGHKVLINGAAGGVRTLAVQIAKSTKPSNAHIQLSRRLQRLARY
jgi:NADPH:quinone reductase-like Zn-dependent oxidoreductase